MSSAPVVSPAPSRTALHVGLWAVQGLLGLAFLAAGVMKSTAPYADLAAQMNWAAHTPEALVRFIGVSELLGGIGLVVPAASRILPWLTPLAAALLVVVMALAASFHVYLGEPEMIVPNLVLGGLAALVAWGRTAGRPIPSR